MKRLVIVLIPLALIGAGCNQHDADAVQSDATNLAHSATKAAGNVELDGEVKTVLNLRKDVDTSTIQIQVQEGNVTLNGRVADEKGHATVLDLVNNIKGVTKVTDNLKVGS